MSNTKRRRNVIPAWEMPADPVKAVFWFIHWSLQVLARFFWILILAGVIYESLVNGVVGGVVTLLVGLGVWLGLIGTLFIFNVTRRISLTVADVNRMQQGFTMPRSFNSSERSDVDDSKVVEGSVTDLEEERKKRRRE
ncbi:MAG TPA: hypothetical protein VK667_08280 [Ktedonobacteraceae bacterium]|nr:hypothetical protein [Ktedonobacteraceae bacterium]